MATGHLTDKDLANLQLAMYGDWDPGWDWFGEVEGVVVGAKVHNGVTDIVLRGSMAMLDFIRDLQALENPHDTHGGLGPVHPGFMQGMQETWQLVKANTRAPRRVQGHSLGAGRATILTGMMILDGEAPLQRTCWGSPRVGFRQLADLIRGVPARSYRNGDGSRVWDVVTAVPVPLGELQYVFASEPIDISAKPDFDLSFDWHHMWPLGYHDMEKYWQGTPETPVCLPKGVSVDVS